MKIEYMTEWPYPKDLDSIESITEYLKKLYSTLEEDSVLRLESTILIGDAEWKTRFTNLLPNSGFGLWSRSSGAGLKQRTTGVQSDYEIGSAAYDEDGETADDSGNWTKTDCTMARTNDSGNGAGSSDYYYTITETGATQRISQALSGLTIGKLYKFSVFIKNGTGTWASAKIKILDNALANTLAETVLATNAAWEDYSVIFVATEATNQMVIDLALGSGETAKLDSMKVIEVIPGCIGANDEGPDWWTKTSTLYLHRIQNDATHCHGLYGVRATKKANTAEYLNAFGRVYNKATHYLRYRGRTIAFGCWVYSVDSSSNVKLQINDSDGTTTSTNYSSSNALIWLEITRTCSSTITSFTPRILFDGDTNDIAYVSQPMLIYGSSIGNGNYIQPRDEVIWCEDNVPSNKFENTQIYSDSNGFVYAEADSSGAIPKDAKSLFIFTKCKDSGSAATAIVYILLRGPVDAQYVYINSIGGLADNAYNHEGGWTPCDENARLHYVIVASGTDTFSVLGFRYRGVQII